MDNDQTVFQSPTAQTTPATPEPTFVPPSPQPEPVNPPVFSPPPAQSPISQSGYIPPQETPSVPFVQTPPAQQTPPTAETPVVDNSSVFMPPQQPVTPVELMPQTPPVEISPVEIPTASPAIVSPMQSENVPSESFVQPPSQEIAAAEPIIKQPLSQIPKRPSGGNSLSPLKKFLKVGIGLVVVLVVLTLLVTVVMPMFSGNSNAKVTLTYWGLWEDGNMMQSLINGFERQNPNIKISYSMQDIKQYRERVLTRIAEGDGPDIFRYHNTWYPMYSSVLLPLPTDTISAADFKKDFYPVTQKDLTKNGGIYGIPLEVDTLSLFVNSQLFKAAGLQPPTNWNDFINDARAMTVKDANGNIKTAGAALGAYDNVTHAPDILSLLFLQNGVDTTKIQDSSDRAANALNFYTAFSTDQNNVWDSTLDPSILAFSKGNLAMYFGYSWDYFTIKQDNPSLAFQIVPVPQLPNQNVNIASYWAEGVSVKSKHQKEALLFMKYLAQKSTEEDLYAQQAKTRAFGEPYARVDLSSALKSNPILSAVAQEAPSAFSSPFVDGTYDNGLNQSLNTYLGTAVSSILNGVSPQTAVDTLAQGATQVFQKYGQ
jgi:multiple sugar transport system substrate-binding protein